MTNQAIQDILSRDLDIPESVDSRIEETLHSIKSYELKAGARNEKSYRKPIYRKPVALAVAVAIILLMFSTIALAYSESFREFVFGNFTVTIFDQGDAYFTETDDGLIVSSNPVGDSPFLESFLSFDEFQQSALFTVREPSFLPENLAYKEAGILLNEDGTFSNAVIITYGCEISYKTLSLSQMYIGEDSMELEVVDRIEHHDYQSATSFETVMIGDIEALLAVTMIDGVQDDYISLSWLCDGFAFMVSTSDFDIDTLIAIAKSV